MTEDEIVDAVRARISAGRPSDLPDGMPVPAPASDEDIAEAEQIIGYPLPPLLRRLYREVANGGFGPFGGVEGLRDGYVGEGPGMLHEYVTWRNLPQEPDAPPAPPPGVLFFCDFGCAMWALLDCRHPEGQMWWWDAGDRHKLKLTLAQWFTAWLSGELSEVQSRPDLVLAEESWSRTYE
jgi:hypothetical protein